MGQKVSNRMKDLNHKISRKLVNKFDLIAFEKLKLRELRVKTVSTNTNVLSLNRKLGFRQTQVEPGARIIGGQAVDLVHFLLEAKEWPKIRQKFVPLAQLAEKQIREWEQAELEKKMERKS